jgi:glycosyltransferase involved in cell wall biosynthesis
MAWSLLGCLPVNVCLVAPRYPPDVGGVERHVAELASGLSGRGIHVEVVTSDPSGRLPPFETRGGVEVRRFRTIRGASAFFISPDLGAWLRRNARRFDVIHAHSYHTPIAVHAWLAARTAGVRFVLTPHYHGTGHSLIRRALHVPYRPVGAALVRAARPLIYVSLAERALLERHFGTGLSTAFAPNGVDVDDILAAQPFDRDERARIVLTAGRLEKYKGVDRVAKAMRLLPDDFRLVVIGSGPARRDIERIAAELSVRGRVELLGVVERGALARWLRTADTFVSMSRHEAFGITLLEASVGGAAVVASDIPAHREVGTYVPENWMSYVRTTESPDDLATLISRGLRHAVSADDVARIPRWSETVNRTLAAYNAPFVAADSS